MRTVKLLLLLSLLLLQQNGVVFVNGGGAVSVGVNSDVSGKGIIQMCLKLASARIYSFIFKGSYFY